MNPYAPEKAKILKVKEENPSIKTFTVRFDSGKKQENFSFLSGQFVEVSVPGAGEFPCSISSSPFRKKSFDLTVSLQGRVSEKMHSLKKNSFIGVRGPYGNSFPAQKLKGKHLNIVAGGLGLAPLRSVIQYALDEKREFSSLNIFFGARSPRELIFRNDLRHWKSLKDVNVVVTIDKKDPDWKGCTGLVADVLTPKTLPKQNSLTLICGPPRMIDCTARQLLSYGFSDREMFVSLERLMHCGIGKCNHCAVGEHRVCVEGPVFSFHEMKRFPHEE